MTTNQIHDSSPVFDAATEEFYPTHATFEMEQAEAREEIAFLLAEGDKHEARALAVKYEISLEEF